MTLQAMNSAAPLLIDAAANATDAINPQATPLDLKAYIPLFSFLGAAAGGIIAALAQTRIARLNADNSNTSRLAVRKEEVISEGVLELIRLDPYKKQDGEANQLALRAANSIKLFLDKEEIADRKLEGAVEHLIHIYACVVSPSMDEELVDRLMILKNPDVDAESITSRRLEELLELLQQARLEVLWAARSLIAQDRLKLRDQLSRN
jgi:hypothetical protein